jgi:hypothetical protein
MPHADHVARRHDGENERGFQHRNPHFPALRGEVGKQRDRRLFIFGPEGWPVASASAMAATASYPRRPSVLRLTISSAAG